MLAWRQRLFLLSPRHGPARVVLTAVEALRSSPACHLLQLGAFPPPGHSVTPRPTVISRSLHERAMSRNRKRRLFEKVRDCAQRARARVGGSSGGRGLHAYPLTADDRERSSYMCSGQDQLEGCCVSGTMAVRYWHVPARRRNWAARTHTPLCGSMEQKLGKALLTSCTRPSSTGLALLCKSGARLERTRKWGFLPSG